MTTPFTSSEMSAQELAALAHLDLTTSDASREGVAGREHETGRDLVSPPLHPARISGCRLAFVGGELLVDSGANVSAQGDAMGGVAMLPTTTGTAAKRASLGPHEVQQYQGAFHQMAISDGLTRLFASSADWSLYIVARLQGLGATTPILWEDGAAIRVYYDPTGELFRVVVQTTSGSQSFSANLPKIGLDYSTGGPSATLIEIECRSGVLGVRVGVATGYTPLIATQAIAGTPIASAATIRVGSDNTIAWATMLLGCVAAYARALTAAELFQLRGWAVQEFGAAIA